MTPSVEHMNKQIKCAMCSKENCCPSFQMKMKMQEDSECEGFKYRSPTDQVIDVKELNYEKE